VVEATRGAPPMDEPAAQRALELLLPDLPAVVVSFPQEPRAPALDVAPPDLPAVVVDLANFQDLRAIIAVRLAKGEPLTHVRLGRRERDAIVAFYAGRDNRPVWLEGETWTPAAKAIIARLDKTYEDGLDPNDYPLPTVAVLPLDNRDVVLADADIKLSVAVAAYARDARGARVDPARLSKLVTPKLDLPDPGAVLAQVSTASDAGAALVAYNPSHKGYLALKAKLAEIRAARPSVPQVKVPAGPSLRIGMRDPRVRLVRIRFGLGIGDSEDETYDERVAAAVADFQKENGLTANGVLNRQTILALALAGVPAARNEGDIVANMERWRWLPASLGHQYIMVNIPDFGIRLVRDGVIVHQARVIVGKPETPTPVFSNTMEHVIVNPYWHVPPSILKNEFLPRMAEDPNYATSRGYEVIQHGDKISIRQPPGEGNALGRIKFMFPNQHSVYLHDTPSRSLFASGRRAYSHGCVRLDQPFRFAELVLGKEQGWTEARVRGLIGKGERLIKLSEPIPIHLAYFTTYVDENGRLVTRDDLYGYNRRVRAALGYGG
jgi:L,D-transpeptidase YcbB